MAEAPTASMEGNPDYQFDGETYRYTDKSTGIEYKWVQDDSVPDGGKWEVVESATDTKTVTEAAGSKVNTAVPQSAPNGHSYQFDGKHYTYKDEEGVEYEWDAVKGAWFPKVDDDFMAKYQLSYGFHADGTVNPSPLAPPSPPAEPTAKKSKTFQEPKPAEWFEIDESRNTSVYVTGLPLDVTEEEFCTFMQKCGFIMRDPENNKMKVKLYTDKSGQRKGDALCTYIKVESVDLALNILNGAQLRDNEVHIERAHFELKGTYDPSKRPRKRKKKDKERIKAQQEKLFDWRPEKMRGERWRHEKVVVIKNMFSPEEIESNPTTLLELNEDLREECGKFGTVQKVVIHDRNKEGVAQVFFETAESADICVTALNKRWFAGKQLEVATWDGKTKYRVVETKEQEEDRLKKWSNFVAEDKQADGGTAAGSSESAAVE